MMCRALEDSGLGRPLEWFNPIHRGAYLSETRAELFSITSYVAELIRGATTPNGVFGAKVHVEHYTELLAQGYDVLRLGFDKVYYIRRRSRLAQAYSIAKAAKTGFWSKSAEEEAGLVTHLDVPISTHELIQGLATIATQLSVYKSVLRPHVTRTFVYEDVLSAGPEVLVRSVAADLNMPLRRIPSRFATRKQSDESDARQLDQLVETLKGRGRKPE
jgi:LPS sulfotransferase NodH